MTAPGWYDDPSGRFGTRWYDGADWTDRVVGANGAETSDPLGGAPPATAPPLPTAPPAPVPFPPGFGPGGFGPPPRPRFRPGLGLAFGAVGLVALTLSLFALDWGRARDSSFLKLSENARRGSAPEDADANVVLAYHYLAWAGFVILGLTVVLVVAGLVPVPATSHTKARVAGAVVAGVGGVMHSAAFSLIATDDRAPGCWLGFAGYYVVIVGFAVGVRQVGAVRLTGQRHAAERGRPA